MSKLSAPVLDLKSAIMLALLAAVWGGSFIFAKIALTEVPPLTGTLYRVALAVPVLAMIVHFRAIAIPRSLRVWGAYLVMGALNNAIPFSLIFWGQTQIEAGLAAILNATTAMFGAFVAGLLLADEALTVRKIVGTILGLVGVAFIMGPEALGGFDLSDLAQLAILGAALSYAFAGVWGRVFLGGEKPFMNAFGMLIGSSVLMVPIVLIIDGPPGLALSANVWAALLSLAVLSTAFAYILYFAILERAGAANVLLVTLLVPVFAIGFGAWFLDEKLQIEAFMGFGIIALGFIVTDGRLLAKLVRAS